MITLVLYQNFFKIYVGTLHLHYYFLAQVTSVSDISLVWQEAYSLLLLLHFFKVWFISVFLRKFQPSHVMILTQVIASFISMSLLIIARIRSWSFLNMKATGLISNPFLFSFSCKYNYILRNPHFFEMKSSGIIYLCIYL